MNCKKDFSQLKKNLKKDFSTCKTVKVGVLGDSSTQFLVQAVRGTGYENGFDLQIREAGFNQIERQIFDPASELFEFKPEIVIIFRSSHVLLEKYNTMKADQHCLLASSEKKSIDSKLHFSELQIK